MTSPRIGSPKPSTRTNNTGISDCRKLQRNSAGVPTAQDARPCDVGPGAASRSAFHLNTRGLGLPVLLGGLLIFLSACASVRSGPFEQFAKNTQSLQTNVENALKVGAGDAQARFLADATQDPSKAQDLLLQPDPSDAFNYQSEDLPLFLTAQRFRARVVDATGVVSEYASALLQLASPDLLSQQEFDEMSKNINADAAKAALAISDQSRPPAAGIGLISTAAGAIFRQFLESKRKKALLRALQANHST
ncbi:MAG TPA: hypothetical protein VLV83_05460, partial [Acidobacteriota bacterium]|nr:hypothetical protein [Acidobacteriota bacterium]